tara:strand:- start:2847 stop:3548 length:702 start_codon:yes stop_codon:yes gene_type:complete
MTKQNKIEFRNLNLSLDHSFFFKNLNLSFSHSGISAIIGPNGSGKTLILKLIMGLVKPSNGEIYLANNSRSNISYASQNVILLRRNVFENLSLPMKINGFSNQFINNRIEKLLKYFRMYDLKNKSARNLSVGKKQYLSVIRSFILDSNILILDEPCANLDDLSTKRIEKFILLEKKLKKKIILVTHDINQAKRLADEIILLNKGKVKVHETKKNFFLERNSLVSNLKKGGIIF